MIIGLSGYARSGKDTVAKVLIENYGYQRVAFADPIRDLLLEMNPLLSSGHHISSRLSEYGWDVTKSDQEVRRLLQSLGVGARKVLGEDVWITKALRSFNSENIVVTDVRFENEAHSLRLLGAQIWRIERPGVKAVNNHLSENRLDNCEFDQYFFNNSTIEDLEFSVKLCMSDIK